MEYLTRQNMTEKLFQRLHSLGILTPELKDHLLGNIEKDLFKDFRTTFKKKYGADVLRCTLPIEWDPFFKAYKMNRYEVTLSPGGGAALASISATDPGSLDIQTAYYCISGKINDLVEQFIRMGFLRDIHQIEKVTYTITQDINDSPTGFDQRFISRTDEGTLICKIPVEAKEHDLFLKNIEAIYIIHPEITHGVFNGVDSRALEESLRNKDWFDAGDMERDYNGVLVHSPEINEIHEKLDEMAKDSQGKVTAHQLKNKYWIQESFIVGAFDPKARVEVKARFPVSSNLEQITNRMKDKAKSTKHKLESPIKKKQGRGM